MEAVLVNIILTFIVLNVVWLVSYLACICSIILIPLARPISTITAIIAAVHVWIG